MEKNKLNNEVEMMCKKIQNTERPVRQAALKELLKIASMESQSGISSDEWFDATHLYIIKCYTDRFEMCRSLAASIISQFILNSLNVNDCYLDYIIPLLKRRIGQGAIVEESEELRLQLIQQTLDVVKVFSKGQNDEDTLMRYYNDIIDIILKTLTDPYACVQRKTCEVINALARATQTFYSRAESLVNPLIVLLHHRQFVTRIIAIETLGYVCLHIDNKNDKIIQIITSISPLLMDAVPFVRRQCGRNGCRWLLELPDRYSFFERILPLILCCLNDDTAEIRDEICSKFVECGRKYFEENEKELQKLELIDGELPCSNYLEKISNVRPTLGCRALVQRSLRMVSIILIELQDWKVEVRLHALKLLSQVILHAEKAFTVKFLDVLPVVAKCCHDDDHIVVNEAKHVATLMGQLLTYDEWIEQALNSLQRNKPSLGLLRCISFLFGGAENTNKFATVHRIAKAVADPSICCSLDYRYQSAILDVTEQMVKLYLAYDNESAKKAEHIAKTEQYLFEILVKICALSNVHDTEAVVGQRGEHLLATLCRSPANQMTLNSKYVGDIIKSIEDLDCEHSERSERILMLYGCIKLCGFQIEYFDTIKHAIRLVMDHSEANAKIKILTATSIAMLNWTKTMSCSTTSESEHLLNEFVDEIIVPNLVWQAGRHAESVRVALMQVLCSIGDSATAEAPLIFQQLATQLSSLAENECALTRAYAIRCILKCDDLPYNDYEHLVPVILNGLEDPCADIRALAIQCTGHLQLDRKSEDYDSQGHHGILDLTFSRLLLHLEDPFMKQRPIILDSIQRIAQKHPKVFQQTIARLPDIYPYSDEIHGIVVNINQ